MDRLESQQEGKLLFTMKKAVQFLNETRKSRGYSFGELGKSADLSHQQIKDVEDGKKDNGQPNCRLESPAMQ